MKYWFSLVRYVPNPARGEFLNVGAVVGSEESSDWAVRQIENIGRARAFGDKYALSAAWSLMDRIRENIEQYEASFGSLFEPETDLTAEWLQQLHQDHRHVVQLSSPVPMVAETADEALDRIFEHMILDRSKPQVRFRKKSEALAALRRAYSRCSIIRDRDFFERVVLTANRHQQKFDFVVRNGQALQLTHSLSFQMPNQVALSDQIKSWGWTVRSTREFGGTVAIRDERVEVHRDVAVEVVYIPPSEGQDTPVMVEARDVFDKLDVTAVPLDQAHSVAMRASKLLSNSKL